MADGPRSTVDPEAMAEGLGFDAELTGGPVLGLDIDGVCVPVDRGEDPAPPGFLDSPSPAMSGRPHWHPRLGEWLDRLDAAFAHVLWATSRVAHSRRLALAAGSERAVDREFAGKPGQFRNVWEPGDFVHPWDGGIPPEVPVAVVDDRFGDDERMPEWIARRSAPTLVAVPNRRVGLGEALVRHLCAFAADPESMRSDMPMAMYGDPGLSWTGATDNPEGWQAGAEGDLRPWRRTDDPYLNDR